MPEFARLQSEKVRDYWDDEEQDFTPWLAETITADETSILEDALNIDLELVDTERAVGSYRLDILARTVDDGRTLVIENQLSDSDHDHLGKALAYAAGTEADAIVWIAPSFNDEHRDAFQWLNQHTEAGVDLFALQLEVLRIGDSKPAPQFTPVAEPSEWQDRATPGTRDLSDREQLNEEFWIAFRDRIEEAGADTDLRPRKPKPQHWYNNPVGRAGFTLSFVMKTSSNELEAKLVIRDNAEAMQRLREQRDEIEAELGAYDLQWDGPSETDAGKMRSQIIAAREAHFKDRDRWNEYVEWLFEAGEAFREAFEPRIDSSRLRASDIDV